MTTMSVDHEQVEAMQRRESEIMRLLQSDSPDRIVHDLRNVMNELSLLRRALEAEG